jgi:hypothetical protein
MRFELSPEMAQAVKGNKAISMGIDYEGFDQLVSPIAEPSRLSLVNDLQ